MPTRSAILVVLLVVAGALLGAGVSFVAPWGKPEAVSAAEAERRQAQQAKEWPLYGFVLNEELYPVPNASLLIVETTAAFSSRSDGSYEAAAKPGTYLVIASANGYRSAAASLTVYFGERTRHDFVLTPKPVGVPYFATTPTTLHMGCALTVNDVALDCAAATSPNRLFESIVVPESTANAVLEIHWEAQSTFATHMTVRSDFAVDGSRIEVANIRGTTGLTLWLLDWFLTKHRAEGSSWEYRVGLTSPLGGADGSGNQGGTGVGFAQDQVLHAYSTLFHYAPGSGNFTALDQ